MSGPHYTKTRKMVTSKINPYRMLENTVCIKLVSCIGFFSVLPKSEFVIVAKTNGKFFSFALVDKLKEETTFFCFL